MAPIPETAVPPETIPPVAPTASDGTLEGDAPIVPADNEPVTQAQPFDKLRVAPSSVEGQ
jgi:hypothetical protein